MRNIICYGLVNSYIALETDPPQRPVGAKVGVPPEGICGWGTVVREEAEHGVFKVSFFFQCAYQFPNRIV